MTTKTAMDREQLKDKLLGIMPFAPTPFRKSDLEVDLAGFRQNIRFLVDHGVESIGVCGFVGEFAAISLEEYSRLIKAAVEIANGQTAIVGGVGHGTKMATAYAQAAQSLGADCVMLLPPYVADAPADGLYQHYKAIAQSVEIGVMLHSLPGGTNNLTPTVIDRLAELPNVIAYKDELRDINRSENDTIYPIPGDVFLFARDHGVELVVYLERLSGVVPAGTPFDSRGNRAGNRIGTLANLTQSTCDVGILLWQSGAAWGAAGAPDAAPHPARRFLICPSRNRAAAFIVGRANRARSHPASRRSRASCSAYHSRIRRPHHHSVGRRPRTPYMHKHLGTSPAHRPRDARTLFGTRNFYQLSRSRPTLAMANRGRKPNQLPNSRRYGTLYPPATAPSTQLLL